MLRSCMISYMQKWQFAGYKYPATTFLLLFFSLFAHSNLLAQAQSKSDQALRARSAQLVKKIEAKKFAHPDSAEYWANKMLKIGEQLEDPVLQSNAYAYLAWVNRTWGNLAQALDDGENALKKAEEASDLLLQANALYEIGIIQHELEHFEEGRRSLVESNQKFERLQDPLGMARTINSIGEIHRIQGEYSLANQSYREARIHFKAANSVKGLILIENNIGLVYAAQGDCKMALDTLEAARRKAIEQEFIGVILESGDQIANCQLQLGQIDSAFANAENVLNMAKESKFLKYAKAAAKTLCDISIVQNEFEAAFKYQEMHYEFSRELMNEATQNRIASLNFALDLREKEAEIEVLNRDKKINSLWMMMAVAGFGAILLFGLVLVFFYQRKRKNNLLLEKQNEALSELNREKDSLINIVAHDLKSPLSKTKGLMTLLPTMSPFNPQQQKVAEMIDKTLDDGDRLIRDLLDISQAEGSTSSFHPIDFELNQLLNTIIATYQEAAEKKHIKMTIKSESGPIQLHTDDSFVTRVFDNLLSNAIKYSANHTEIIIESGINGQKAWFSVQDQGPGFSPEDKAKMFRKFQRLSARPTGGESSNGLGLAIIQLLANKLQASIELDTALGKGSKFIIQFPTRIASS